MVRTTLNGPFHFELVWRKVVALNAEIQGAWPRLHLSWLGVYLGPRELGLNLTFLILIQRHILAEHPIAEEARGAVPETVVQVGVPHLGPP